MRLKKKIKIIRVYAYIMYIPTSTRVSEHAQGVVNVTRIIIIIIIISYLQRYTSIMQLWFSGHASQG